VDSAVVRLRFRCHDYTPPHPHPPALGPISDPSTRQTIAIIALTVALLFMGVELVGGLYAHSLAIITDAAHLLTDVSGFAVSLAVAYYASAPTGRGANGSRQHFSYGCVTNRRASCQSVEARNAGIPRRAGLSCGAAFRGGRASRPPPTVCAAFAPRHGARQPTRDPDGWSDDAQNGTPASVHWRGQG